MVVDGSKERRPLESRVSRVATSAHSIGRSVGAFVTTGSVFPYRERIGFRAPDPQPNRLNSLGPVHPGDIPSLA
jgi:hypothetical protein